MKVIHVEPCKNCKSLFKVEEDRDHTHYSGTGCICPRCVDHINRMVNGN